MSTTALLGLLGKASVSRFANIYVLRSQDWRVVSGQPHSTATFVTGVIRPLGLGNNCPIRGRFSSSDCISVFVIQNV
jgi:hypothetical protein